MHACGNKAANANKQTPSMLVNTAKMGVLILCLGLVECEVAQRADVKKEVVGTSHHPSGFNTDNGLRRTGTEHVLQSTKLRFGDGTSTSIDSSNGYSGNLKQPFYSTDGSNWTKLSYSTQSTFFKIRVGGPESYTFGPPAMSPSNYAQNGTLLSTDLPYTLDANGFTVSSGNNTGYGALSVTQTHTNISGGATLTVERTYSIPGADRSTLSTDIKMCATGAMVTNIRVWFAFRDDYVGTGSMADEPSKQIGDWADGSFVPVNTTTNMGYGVGKVLKVFTPDEFVFIYSTSDKSKALIAGTGSSGLLNADPFSSQTNITSDDNSFGVFVDVGDLAAGTCATRTVGYAAGSISAIAEVAAAAAPPPPPPPHPPPTPPPPPPPPPKQPPPPPNKKKKKPK